MDDDFLQTGQTRHERWVEGALDRAREALRTRDYRGLADQAVEILHYAEALKLLGPEGYGANSPMHDRASVDHEQGDDAPAGAGHDVQAERG